MFPAPVTKPLENYYPGISIRDYFAAKAMQGFIERAPTGTQFGVSHTVTNETFGVAAYAMADAMLKARET